jgi:hypothetical protein
MNRYLKILGLGAFLALGWMVPASAQQVNNYWFTGTPGQSCPSCWVPVSAANPLPVSASVTASIAGFHPETSLTPITATTAGVPSSTFTAGKSVLVQNTGATNAAYCFPGGSATVNSEYIPPGASALITTTSETTITCATAISTTTLNLQVGTGLWTGAGGGSGGGSGGNVNVTQWNTTSLGVPTAYGTAPSTGNYIGVNAFITNTVPISVASSAISAGAGIDGWDLTQGTKSDGPCANGSTTPCSVEARLAHIENLGAASVPYTVNGTPTAATAVTPGSAQTGTIVAPNSDLTSVGGTAILKGTGATGTGSPRTTVAVDQATNAGAALVKGGVGVVNGGSFYQAVAASQTATVLQSSTGAIGDYLSHCVLYPTSTSPGVVTVFDNTNAAGTSAILFPGGASSLSNLAPIAIPVGSNSVSGAWKVTTGASISVVCYGKFS